MTMTDFETARSPLGTLPQPVAAHLAESVPCDRCRGPVPTESFVYWAFQRRVVWLFASCPTCRHPAKRASG